MRTPDFAGTWYPENRRECLQAIAEFDRELGEAPERGAPIRAIMAPHAGWFYSGLTARAALRRAASEAVDRIVIFGRHLSPHDPPILIETDVWRTPLRDVEIDRDALDRIKAVFNGIVETDRRHQRDNTIELVLALAAHAYPNATLVALGAPPSPLAIELGRSVAAALGETSRTLFLASTDLTHYGPNYGFTPRGLGAGALTWAREENDADFIRAVAAGDPRRILASAVARQNACCAGAVAAAWSAASMPQGELIRYATSADRQGGPATDFVGYAGMVA
jgi:hypothetical protein